MEQAETLLALYGAEERPETLQQVSVGPLSFLYTQSGLRRISWHGTELVRAIGWPIRDENWGTYPQEVVSEVINDDDEFDAKLTFSSGEGRLVCDLHIRANLNGELLADLTMTPKDGAFSTNRAGFTILHPITGVAGAPLLVTRPDGTHAATEFPERIQPDQPVKEISGLSYGVDAQFVEIHFDGEVFEMEDQRNWSDASFKAYCVPLVHPFTYDITEITKQSVRIQFSGGAASTKRDEDAKGIRFYNSGQRALDIGIALETGWAKKGLIQSLRPSHVSLRTSPKAEDLQQLCASARNAGAVDLELVLPDDEDVAEGLKEVAEALSKEGIEPQRAIALRRSYLASHQPVGPWPSGPTPNEMLPLVREAFPNALVGGGMLTNFTELNRCRPDANVCDYITHGLTPLVHAGDDMSVLETLEALPQIFSSAEALAQGKPYRLGLASIGMRSNPYGAAVAENPDQVRRTMARIDPRHRGLFGAAFAVGVLASTESSKVEALCLGAPKGPFGLVYEPADYPQAGYDGTDRVVYPLFHVVREVCALADFERLSIGGLPKQVAGYGALEGDAVRILLANVSASDQEVVLGQRAKITLLDADAFDAATRREDWLETASAQEAASLVLPPFAVAFVRTSFSET